MPFIEQLGQQLGQQAAQGGLGAIMGLALEKHNDRRQLKQQGKLQELEIRGLKEMGQFNLDQEMRKWEMTGYGAQKDQMKRAGLNPALMYGMSGGGGQSSATATGNISGTDAPKGGGEQIAAMGLSMQAAQLSLLEAQRKNIEADTQNKLGDAANKPLQGENIKQDTQLKESQTTLADIAGHIQGRSQNMQIAMIQTELLELTERLQIQVNNKKISDATMNDEIKKVKYEAIGMFLKNLQTKEETKAIGVELAQKWESLRLTGLQLNYTEWEAAIKQQLADYQTAHPNVGQVTGNILDQILKLIKAK